MVRPKIVWSIEWDPGHHEELRNGPENKIHIWESPFRVSKKFGIFPVSYWGSSRMFWRGHQWGPPIPEGPRGPRGGTQAYLVLGHQPPMAHAASPWATLKRGDQLGGQVFSLPPLGAGPRD